MTGLAAAYDAASRTAVFHGGTKGDETTRTAWGLRCGDAAPTPTASPSPTGSATPPEDGVYLPRLLKIEP